MWRQLHALWLILQLIRIFSTTGKQNTNSWIKFTLPPAVPQTFTLLPYCSLRCTSLHCGFVLLQWRVPVSNNCYNADAPAHVCNTTTHSWSSHASGIVSCVAMDDANSLATVIWYRDSLPQNINATMEQGAMEMNNVVAKQNHAELQGTEWNLPK
jgi:hypothetical protein